jgi:hypothetical protein
VRVVAIAEHSDVDHVRWRRIVPDLGIDALQVDPPVEPAADPVIAAVGSEVREAADAWDSDNRQGQLRHPRLANRRWLEVTRGMDPEQQRADVILAASAAQEPMVCGLVWGFSCEIIERGYGKTFYFHDPNGIRLQIELKTKQDVDSLDGDPDPVPYVHALLHRAQ